MTTTLVLAPSDHAHFVANRGARAVERLRRRDWSVDVHAGAVGGHALVHRAMRVDSLAHAVAAVHRDHTAGTDTRTPSAPSRSDPEPSTNTRR